MKRRFVYAALAAFALAITSLSSTALAADWHYSNWATKKITPVGSGVSYIAAKDFPDFLPDGQGSGVGIWSSQNTPPGNTYGRVVTRCHATAALTGAYTEVDTGWTRSWWVAASCPNARPYVGQVFIRVASTTYSSFTY